MPRTPRLLVGLSIVNGLLTLIAAIVFAAGPYGAFRPQDSGAFRSIGGLLVAFAALACIAFTVAANQGHRGLIAGLSIIDAIANTVFLLSPFHVPHEIHLLVIFSSLVVFVVAITETPGASARIPTWSAVMILFGSMVGGTALIGVGRFTFYPGAIDSQAIAGLAIALAGLTLFAVGTGGAVAGRFDLQPNALLVAATAGACVAAIVTGLQDLNREGVGYESFAAVGTPWSARFWILITAMLVSGLLLGAGPSPTRERVSSDAF